MRCLASLMLLPWLFATVSAQPTTGPTTRPDRILLVPATQPSDLPPLPDPGKPIGDWPQSGFRNPSTQPYSAYAGRAFDEQWFADAERRIAELRTAPLRVEVVDADGKPIAGAEVHVRMTRHAFHFGSALSDAMLRDSSRRPDVDRARFQAAFPRLFNTATLEGGLRWANWINPRFRPVTLEIIDWVEQQRLALRGHTLVYPGWAHLPRHLQSLQDKPAEINAAIAEHIADLAGTLRGRVWAWDVLNEPHSHQNLQRVVGYDQTAEWFRLARAADPNARLVVNENNTIESGLKLDGFLKAVQILVDHGAPFDAIGLQGHFRASRFHHETNPLPTPQVWWERVQKFADFGKRLEITEFDVFNDTEAGAVRFNEADEARLTYEFMTLAFSHPQVDAFILWGFWSGAHWMNNAPIYRKDWSLKPSGEVYFNLVFHRWWTDVRGSSDAGGQFETRGFLGDYEIEARVGDRSARKPFRLTKDANVLRLQL